MKEFHIPIKSRLFGVVSEMSLYLQGHIIVFQKKVSFMEKLLHVIFWILDVKGSFEFRILNNEIGKIVFEL